MKILVFSDIHCDWEALRKIVVKKADIYICLGDLSRFGEGLGEAGKILAPLKDKLLLIPGNHETWEQTRSLCQKFGFVDFHQKVIEKNSFSFAGLGLSTPGPFNTPGEISEEEFEKSLESFEACKNLLLFCHHPPKDSELDILTSSEHVGSQAIRDFIENHMPLYFFSGHIHENERKIQRISQATCFGVGKMGLEIWL